MNAHWVFWDKPDSITYGIFVDDGGSWRIWKIAEQVEAAPLTWIVIGYGHD